MSRITLVVAAVFGFALGGAGPGAGDSSVAAAPSAETPSLWSIDTPGGGATRTTGLICAGAVIRQGFGRALPEANGQSCAMIDQAQTQAGVFNGRCRLGDAVFNVHSVTSGDLSRDFTVKSVMKAEAGAGRRFVSSLRYRKVLASCPAGWIDGDAGSPGDQRVVNSISGVAHPVSPPVAAP